MLDRSVLRDLNTLGPKADTVALHLIAAGNLVDDDAERALAHVRYARDQAPRIAAVREAAGIVAYQAGEWAEAARDLRACRRITGDSSHLAIIADCERAMGRADRAITLATGPEVAGLPRTVQAELVIVHSGARRDLAEVDGALVALERFGLDRAQQRPWSARLWYAYADALVDAGRVDDAAEWFEAAAGVDEAGETDADERVVELRGSGGDTSAHAEDDESIDDLDLSEIEYDDEALGAPALDDAAGEFDADPTSARDAESAAEDESDAANESSDDRGNE